MPRLRIGMVGVPGAGKTTLSRALAGFVRERIPELKTIELVHEYARVYIHKYGMRDVVDQHLILKKQLKREDAYPDNVDLLISDSPVFLGLAYAMNNVKDGDIRDHKILIELIKDMLSLNVDRRYDIIFHIPPVLKPVKDGIRSDIQFDDGWRADMDADIKAVFKLIRPHRFITIHSTKVEDRISECVEHIKQYMKEKSSV